MLTVRTIRNCPLRFKPDCPKDWGNLAPTLDSGRRHCDRCERDVFFCSGIDDTLEHGRAGHLVARNEPIRSELPPVRLDGPPFNPSPAQLAAEAAHRREHGITTLLNGRIVDASRNCPSCNFPVPNFRLTCYVCEHHVGRV
jgi:hypothetical protein